MKKTVLFALVWLILILPLLSTVSAQGAPKLSYKEKVYYQGVIAGTLSAKDKYHPNWWFALGMIGGTGQLVGTTAVCGVSQIYKVSPPEEELNRIVNRSPEFKEGFIVGYSTKAKNKKMWYAAGGGIIGTILIIAAVTT